MRALVLLLAALAAGDAYAHGLGPSLLELREETPGRFQVTWRTPRIQFVGASVAPVLPERCRRVTPAVEGEPDVSVTLRWVVDCGGEGVVGERVGVDGLGAARTEALLRIALADGRVVERVLRAAEPSLVVPVRPRPLDVFRDYLRYGVEHILSGPDHLLFVFGLLLLVPAARPLVQTITAFTAGHSVTLSLAVLGIATVPSRAVEVVIALTVLVLAVELARTTPSPTFMRRFPWAMSLLFGLLHGLAFAGALAEVGLPSGEIPLALFSFNCGIEVGQLAFVLAVLALGRVVRRLPERLPAWIRQVPVYAMGSLAAFWCFQRTVLLLR